MKKNSPFRLTPYQVQFLLVVGFCHRRLCAVTCAISRSNSRPRRWPADAGLQIMLCKARALATVLFRNSVFRQSWPW